MTVTLPACAAAAIGDGLRDGLQLSPLALAHPCIAPSNDLPPPSRPQQNNTSGYPVDYRLQALTTLLTPSC